MLTNASQFFEIPVLVYVLQILHVVVDLYTCNTATHTHIAVTNIIGYTIIEVKFAKYLLVYYQLLAQHWFC